MTAREGGELTSIISMRISSDDVLLLDSVAALAPVIPRLTLARIALRIGLMVAGKVLAPKKRRRCGTCESIPELAKALPKKKGRRKAKRERGNRDLA